MPPKGTIEGYHRAKVMLPAIRQLIWSYALSSDMNREDLAEELLMVIKQNYPKEIPPKIETIVRQISKARNSKRSPLDEPWTLGACRDYPSDFPASSLPILIKYKSMKFQTISEEPDTSLHFNEFSIRQAKWIVRLYPIIKESFQFSDYLDEYSAVTNAAEGYSQAEFTSEAMGEKTFNTQILDEALCSQDIQGICVFGLGQLIKTDSICKNDCNSCKYEPAFEGKLSESIEGKFCQPKGRREYIEKLEKKYVEGKSPFKKDKGE